MTSKKSNKISKEDITLSSFNNCNFWFEQWLHETITHELRESICHIHKNPKNYSYNFQFLLFLFFGRINFFQHHICTTTVPSHMQNLSKSFGFSLVFSQIFRSSDLLFFELFQIVFVYLNCLNCNYSVFVHDCLYNWIKMLH